MKKFNLKELVSHLEEDHREFGMADTIFTYFKYNHLPIKINGIVKDELKEFKASFCIYDSYIEDYGVYDYKQDFELLILQEYDDSPLSIYINTDGEIDSYEYKNINTIEIGDSIVLQVEDGFVTHYSCVHEILSCT
jgi:hypothetical protein